MTTYNLAQVDSFRRPLGSKKKPIRRPPVAMESNVARDRGASAALASAVLAAAGGRVFVREFAGDDWTRTTLANWARTVPGWECGTGYPPGKSMGRPSIWVRLRGGAK